MNRPTSAFFQRHSNSLLILFVALLVTGLSVQLTRERYQDFLDYHRTIAQGSVQSIAHEVERFVTEQHRRVQLFAEDHAALIQAIARQPDNYDLQDQLAGKIKRRFPRFFAFTITDSQGRPLIEDFDGFVGQLCIADVQTFSRTKTNLVRIHPNNFAYHFDVMAPYGNSGGESGILMINFHADELGNLLASGQVPGHQLVLAIADMDHLIEVTSEGSRNKLDRQNFTLTEAELARMITTQEIAGTRWSLANLYRAGFREGYLRDLVITQGIILLLILLVLTIIGYFMRRLEQRRERAESFKDEFLSVVSHELRTPITAIQGALSLIKYQFPAQNDQYAELMNIADSNSTRLRLLVDDLLEVRALDAGKLKLDYQPCHLNDLVAESLKENHGYAEKCRVRFQAGRRAEMDRVLADERRLKQVMANYLSNAAKFSPDGAVVTAHVEQTSDNWVRVSVVDQGEGVPEEFQAQLFEKFSQADGSSSRKIAGTGLGLAIVKGLVEAHDGRVGCDSTPGKGTTFYFELPLAD